MIVGTRLVAPVQALGQRDPRFVKPAAEGPVCPIGNSPATTSRTLPRSRQGYHGLRINRHTKHNYGTDVVNRGMITYNTVMCIYFDVGTETVTSIVGNRQNKATNARDVLLGT